MRFCILVLTLLGTFKSADAADKQEVAAHVFSFAATVGDVGAGAMAQGGRR